MKSFSPSPGLLVPLSLLLLLSLSPGLSPAQSWERIDISYSGCSVSLPSEPEWEYDLAQDSSLIWVGEVVENDIFYGVICVEFSQPFEFDVTREEMIGVAESYLDYLQTEFSIVSHTGYVTSHFLESNEEACGVSDSWQDAEGDPWYIQSWIDPFNMVVLYMYSDPENSMDSYKDYFFSSFLFPEY